MGLRGINVERLQCYHVQCIQVRAQIYEESESIAEASSSMYPAI